MIHGGDIIRDYKKINDQSLDQSPIDPSYISRPGSDINDFVKILKESDKSIDNLMSSNLINQNKGLEVSNILKSNITKNSKDKSKINQTSNNFSSKNDSSKSNSSFVNSSVNKNSDVSNSKSIDDSESNRSNEGNILNQINKIDHQKIFGLKNFVGFPDDSRSKVLNSSEKILNVNKSKAETPSNNINSIFKPVEGIMMDNQNNNYLKDRRKSRIDIQVDRIRDLTNNQNLHNLGRRKTIETHKLKALKQKRASEIHPGMITDMIKRSDVNNDYISLRDKIYLFDFILGVLVTINIILSMVDNELYIEKANTHIINYMNTHNINLVNLTVLQQMDQREISQSENALRMINCVLCISNIIILFFNYKFQIKLAQLDRKLSVHDNLISSGLIKYFLAESVIMIVCYPPFLNNVVSGEMLGLLYVYNYNAIISVIVCTKLYILGRVFSYYSRWTSDTAVAICNKYKVKTGMQFAIKSEMKKRPEIILSLLLLFVLSLLAFALRTFEYGIISSNDTSVNLLKGSAALKSLDNCFWLIIVTMTTVGYGDYYPRSHLGRFVGVIACILGMLLLSLVVVSLGSISEFTSEEKKAFTRLKKLLADDNLQNKSASVIKTIILLNRIGSISYRLQNKNKNKLNNINERFILFTSLKKEISIYNNDYKIANSHALPIDEMLKGLQNKLKEDIQKLSQNIEEVNKVNEDLESITKEQESIHFSMKEIISMQNDIAEYIITINNENFKKNLIKRTLSDERIKRRTSLISNKQPSFLLNIRNSPLLNKLSKTPETRKIYVGDVNAVPPLDVGGGLAFNKNNNLLSVHFGSNIYFNKRTVSDQKKPDDLTRAHDKNIELPIPSAMKFISSNISKTPDTSIFKKILRNGKSIISVKDLTRNGSNTSLKDASSVIPPKKINTVNSIIKMIETNSEHESSSKKVTEFTKNELNNNNILFKLNNMEHDFDEEIKSVDKPLATKEGMSKRTEDEIILKVPDINSKNYKNKVKKEYNDNSDSISDNSS